jgi:Domain of unknown function (DUF1906)
VSVLGVDYAWSRPDPKSLAALGFRFVIRYLSHDATKNLTGPEVTALHAAGLAVGLNWEDGATNALGGSVAGIADAKSALAQARALGAPAGTCIEFSLDFDLQPSQVPICRAYIDGVTSVLRGTGYIVGVYGGLKTVQSFGSDNWQTLAWSYGVWLRDARLRQTEVNVTVAGASVDIDQATVWPLPGLWQPHTAPHQPPPTHPHPPKPEVRKEHAMSLLIVSPAPVAGKPLPQYLADTSTLSAWWIDDPKELAPLAAAGVPSIVGSALGEAIFKSCTVKRAAP